MYSKFYSIYIQYIDLATPNLLLESTQKDSKWECKE